MAFAGRLAIIAGGLGGLGTATSQLLLSHGAKVALLYAPFEASRKDSILSSTYGSTNPANISTHECDITSESSVKQAFGTIPTNISDSFPSILVNAAGYVTVQPLEATSADEFTRNLIPNLLGPFLVSKEFFELYRRSSGAFSNGNSDNSKPPPGRIVSISSQAAHVALEGHGPYCASKAGLNALTRCMANEWAKHNITSNTVSPTVALTVLGKKAWADDEKRNNMLSMIPTGRFAEPAEIAQAIVDLCGDGMGMVNGADLRIDGGFTIR